MLSPGFIAPDVYGLPGLHIEAKRRDRVSLPAALRQSREDAGNGEVPVVMHRGNGCGWIVSAWLADLLALSAAVNELNASKGDADGVTAGLCEPGGPAVRWREGGFATAWKIGTEEQAATSRLLTGKKQEEGEEG